MNAPDGDHDRRSGLVPRDKVDFGRAAEDYAAHRPPFDSRLFARLAGLGVGLPSQLILDVGAGTGLLGRGITGNGARVVESDLRLSLLRQSAHVDRVAARAEQLPFSDET